MEDQGVQSPQTFLVKNFSNLLNLQLQRKHDDRCASKWVLNWILITDFQQLPGLMKTKMVMYIIASKLKYTFGTIGNATADKMTAKMVEKLEPYALAWRNRELTNRRLSHDGAVASPYSPGSSSSRNLNLRCAVKTTTFMRDRQIFPLFLKFVFIFWQGELFKLKCLTSEKRGSSYSIRLWKQLHKRTGIFTFVRLSCTSQQIQSFCSGTTTGSI